MIVALHAKTSGGAKEHKTPISTYNCGGLTVCFGAMFVLSSAEFCFCNNLNSTQRLIITFQAENINHSFKRFQTTKNYVGKLIVWRRFDVVDNAATSYVKELYYVFYYLFILFFFFFTFLQNCMSVLSIYRS